jgi:hypothetical protein
MTGRVLMGTGTGSVNPCGYKNLHGLALRVVWMMVFFDLSYVKICATSSDGITVAGRFDFLTSNLLSKCYFDIITLHQP